ncbi:hypothetical protein LIA77_11660 [Sarocladium implicatum]|nr:hypothetical protein LIA77_11660 [Sarocladium implicatum]
MLKNAFLFASLALARLASAKSDSSFKFTAKFDPEHADTVEDASWNCIVELGDANPEQICNKKVIHKNLDKLTKLCSLGNQLMFDQLHHEYCRVNGVEVDDRILHPGKRPYLKKPKPTVTTTVVNINIIEGNLVKPTTLTVTAAGKSFATVTLSPNDSKMTEAAVAKKPAMTTFRTKVKDPTRTSSTKTAPSKTSKASDTQRTCASAPDSDSGEYDNGQWCVGKYEQAFEKE